MAKRDDVECAAAALLAVRRPAIKAPPVPVDELAEEVEGLDIQEAEEVELVAGGPQVPSGVRLSGLLLPSEKRIWVSAAEARSSAGRRRFTIAHELGHWRLHAGQGKQTRAAIYCRPDQVNDGREDLGNDMRTEAEANRFAATLLMPEGLVRRDARDHKLNVPLLAKRFGVSSTAMRLRLDVLDLLPTYMR